MKFVHTCSFFRKVVAGGGTAVFWGGSSSYSAKRHWGWLGHCRAPVNHRLVPHFAEQIWASYKTSLSGMLDRATPPGKKTFVTCELLLWSISTTTRHTDYPMLFLDWLWLAFVSGSNFVVKSPFMRCHAVSLQATQPSSCPQPNRIKKQLSSTAVSLRHKMPIPRIWLPGAMYIEHWKV